MKEILEYTVEYQEALRYAQIGSPTRGKVSLDALINLIVEGWNQKVESLRQPSPKKDVPTFASSNTLAQEAERTQQIPERLDVLPMDADEPEIDETQLLTDEEKRNVNIPCGSCDSSRNLGRMNIGSTKCLDCAVKCHIKAQLAKDQKRIDGIFKELDEAFGSFLSKKVVYQNLKERELK